MVSAKSWESRVTAISSPSPGAGVSARRLGGFFLAEHDADLALGHDQFGFRHGWFVTFPNGGGVGNDGRGLFRFRLPGGLLFTCPGDLFPQGGEQVRRHAVKADFRQAGSAFLIFVGRFKLG